MALIGIDDTAAVVDELHRRKKEDDPEHFHQYEVDDAGRLRRLFWADADALVSSVCHSEDVVVIDTVLRTNRYGAAFLPFLGMNHHRRPVLLGCGVLADQSPESCVWLLEAFMMSRAQVSPKSVITDGGDALVHAVETVIPQSNHRICSCQLERGIGEHLAGWSARDGFRSLMSFEDGCSPVEFEEQWHSFVAGHRSASNQEWLCRMYVKRELWAAAFVRDKFFLGMARDDSTECLCVASGLRTRFSEDMTLLALLRRADSRGKYMQAQEADKSRVELTTQHKYLEEDAARFFTPANFAIVLEEIEALDDFEIVETLSSSSDRSGDKVYTLDRHGELFNVLQSHDRAGQHKDAAGVVFKCSCRKMERDGLPCRHILHVLRHERASSIPNCCKLPRLRRRGATRHERLEEMEPLGRQVFDLASQDAEEFEEMKGFLQDWLQERRGHNYYSD